MFTAWEILKVPWRLYQQTWGSTVISQFDVDVNTAWHVYPKLQFGRRYIDTYIHIYIAIVLGYSYKSSSEVVFAPKLVLVWKTSKREVCRLGLNCCQPECMMPEQTTQTIYWLGLQLKYLNPPIPTSIHLRKGMYLTPRNNTPPRRSEHTEGRDTPIVYEAKYLGSVRGWRFSFLLFLITQYSYLDYLGYDGCIPEHMAATLPSTWAAPCSMHPIDHYAH